MDLRLQFFAFNVSAGFVACFHSFGKELKVMRCVKSFLAGLLITSTALGGVPARAGESSSVLMRDTLAEVQQSGGGVEEREQGRSLLHRGKAGDALVRLERERNRFSAAGKTGDW